MAKVVIAFDTFGNVKADAIGFTGTACEDATNKILAGIASSGSQEEKKEEYYSADTAAQTKQQGIATRW